MVVKREGTMDGWMDEWRGGGRVWAVAGAEERRKEGREFCWGCMGWRRKGAEGDWVYGEGKRRGGSGLKDLGARERDRMKEEVEGRGKK